MRNGFAEFEKKLEIKEGLAAVREARLLVLVSS
jgi:hypothetical protein